VLQDLLLGGLCEGVDILHLSLLASLVVLMVLMLCCKTGATNSVDASCLARTRNVSAPLLKIFTLRFYRPVGSHPRLVSLLDPPVRGFTSNKNDYHYEPCCNARFSRPVGSHPILVGLLGPQSEASHQT